MSHSKSAKEAVTIDPKQQRHLSTQGAKTARSAASSSANGGKKSKKKPKKRRSIFGMILRFIGCLICVGIMACSVGAVMVSMYVVQVTADDNLDLDALELKQTTIVYDKDGNESNTFAGNNNRIWRSLGDIPLHLQQAVIAVEDMNFYNEPGINIKRTIAAALNEFTDHALLGSQQGASTLEQQLIKNLTGDDETDIMRKVREIFRALGLANRYSKETVLEAYLNTIPLTGTIYGMEVGANTYFGKHVEELSLAECAVLASITKNPTNYNPFTNPENVVQRRNHVLALMRNQGYITAEECTAAQNEPLTLAETQTAAETATRTANNSYFDDAVFEELTAYFMDSMGYSKAEAQNEIFTGGYRVYTTMDPKIQAAAERIMLNEPDEKGNELFPALWHEEEVNSKIPVGAEITYDENGFPMNPDDEGSSSLFTKDDIPVYSDEANRVFKTKPDENNEYLLFFEEVRTQAAMTVMDYDGNVLALVGGLGEKKYDRTINRATVPHQTGSTMKPIAAYAKALDYRLITYSSPMIDTPYYSAESKQVLKPQYAYLNKYDPSVIARNDVWRSWPENYGGVGGNGSTMLVYDALRQSYNTVAAWIGSYVGAQNLFNFAHDTLQCQYLNAEHDADLGPIVLGSQTYGLTMVELAGAYSMFWDGTFTTPHLINEVYDSDGNLIWDNTRSITTVQAIKPSTATIMNRMMQNVLKSGGTANGMAPEGEMEAAAKTGTTSDFKDYTFVGMTPYYVTSVWWGFDKPCNMYDLGGKNGKPTQYAWKYLMEEVQKDLPVKEFPIADDVVTKQFNPSTGEIISSGGQTGYYTEDNLPNNDWTATENDDYAAQAQAAQDNYQQSQQQPQQSTPAPTAPSVNVPSGDNSQPSGDTQPSGNQSSGTEPAPNEPDDGTIHIG